MNHARVKIPHLYVVLKVGRADDWKSHENMLRYWRDDMLLLQKLRDVSIADLQGTR